MGTVGTPKWAGLAWWEWSKTFWGRSTKDLAEGFCGNASSIVAVELPRLWDQDQDQDQESLAWGAAALLWAAGQQLLALRRPEVPSPRLDLAHGLVSE